MAAVLFYTIGYPGAGKTTLAKNLAAKLGAEHIYGDQIGYELFTHPKFTPDEVQQVRAAMEQRAIQSLSDGKSVIYDAMLHTRDMRQRLAAIARANNATAIGLYVRVPEKIARERASIIRTADFATSYVRQVPKEVFDKHLQMFEPPHPKELTIEAWGTATFPMQYSSLITQLRDLKTGLS